MKTIISKLSLYLYSFFRLNVFETPVNKNISKTLKRGTKDTKGTVKLINLKQTDNAMAKNKKRQTEKE